VILFAAKMMDHSILKNRFGSKKENTPRLFLAKGKEGRTRFLSNPLWRGADDVLQGWLNRKFDTIFLSFRGLKAKKIVKMSAFLTIIY
jgi:hypothetical protein